jgi:hypothetical protein
MSILAPFNPSFTQGQTVTAAAAAASVAVNANAKQVTITNTGANIAYVRTGTGTFSATAADMPVLAGTQISITKGEGTETFSYISAAGTTLHVIPGDGW